MPAPGSLHPDGDRRPPVRSEPLRHVQRRSGQHIEAIGEHLIIQHNAALPAPARIVGGLYADDESHEFSGPLGQGDLNGLAEGGLGDGERRCEIGSLAHATVVDGGSEGNGSRELVDDIHPQVLPSGDRPHERHG